MPGFHARQTRARIARVKAPADPAKETADAPALFGEGELAPAPEPMAEQGLAIWNEIAEKAGWPTARFLTASRRRAFKRAIPDYGGIVGWRQHLETSARNAFLTGKTNRSEKHANWRPDLDWFLKDATIIKVLENKWPADADPVPVSISRQSDPDNEWGRRTRNYVPRGLWIPHWGPRPEQVGCQAPPAWLVPWREKHGIVVEVPRSETRAERIAASIVSYRKIGRHDRANALEAELAALEGKTATLVPHPDAASHGMPQRAETPAPRRDNRGHNGPPGPITDVDEDPGWDAVPEGDEATAEP